MTMTSITEWIRTLYDYSAWANNRVLDTAGQLTDAQFLQGGGASFDSLRDTLVHTLSAQWIWLSRWQGYSPGAMLIPEEFTDLQFVRDHWRVVETDTQVRRGLGFRTTQRGSRLHQYQGPTLFLSLVATDGSPGQPRYATPQRGRRHADAPGSFPGVARPAHLPW